MSIYSDKMNKAFDSIFNEAYENGYRSGMLDCLMKILDHFEVNPSEKLCLQCAMGFEDIGCEIDCKECMMSHISEMKPEDNNG